LSSSAGLAALMFFFLPVLLPEHSNSESSDIAIYSENHEENVTDQNLSNPLTTNESAVDIHKDDTAHIQSDDIESASHASEDANSTAPSEAITTHHNTPNSRQNGEILIDHTVVESYRTTTIAIDRPTSSGTIETISRDQSNNAQSRSSREDISQSDPGALVRISDPVDEIISTNSQLAILSPLGQRALNLLDLEIRKDNIQVPIIDQSQKKEPLKLAHPWLVSAHFSSVSSWTPNGQSNNVDLGLGLNAKYFVNPKLAVSLGATYIDDFFIAEEGDYKANRDFWKAAGAPNVVEANNQMVEVTTGLAFYFNGIRNNGLSAQLGINSTFMISEQYDYLFTEESNNWSSSWTGDNNKWFNSLDLSTQYKIGLKNNFLIEAGPFVKVPISGIGHGDVLLSSAGIT